MLGGLRAGETLTSAQRKKRNMANNLSETLNCTAVAVSFQRERRRKSLQIPVELRGHTGRAHGGGGETPVAARTFCSVSNLRMSARTWSTERRVRI